MEREEISSGLWHEVYQAAGEPPYILWNIGDRLTCDTGRGPKTGWWPEWSKTCLDGATTSPDVVEVARWAGATLAQTALSHEFAHALNFRNGGDGDFGHESAAFKEGGIVEQGETWLRVYESGTR